MKLSEMLENPSVKANIVADCAQLIETQVSAKGGISGLALKATYKVLKGIDANYISGAIARLLPSIFKALDPLWEEGCKTGDPVNYLSQHQTETANTLLGITDARIKHVSSLVRSAYNKVRKSVQGDVEAAVPALAQIIGQYQHETGVAAY
ncbi:MAG: hypothetical protein ACFB0C_15950 [Leptolyngbyaceae cyanobacterium]